MEVEGINIKLSNLDICLVLGTFCNCEINEVNESFVFFRKGVGGFGS